MEINTHCGYFVECAICRFTANTSGPDSYDAFSIARQHIERNPTHRVEVRHSNVVEAGRPYYEQSGPTEEEREAMQG